MSIICIIFCVSLAIDSSSSKMCPESVPTISVVPRCPLNAREWVSAAKQKSCNELGQVQTCTNPDQFVYHCVLNGQATKLLEVCAPTWFMTGYCARFSEEDKRIINDPSLDCTKFNPPCPTRFSSNESYKYQACYQEISKKSQLYHQNKHSSTTIIVYIFLGICAFATIVLLILLCLGWRLKRKHERPEKKNNCDDENDKERCSLLEDQDNGPSSSTDSDTITYTSLSGERKGRCSLKGIKTIGDVMTTLSRDLGIQRQFLFIVDTITGQILKEEDELKSLQINCIELMIGNQNRNERVFVNVDGNVENDVIDNKKLTSGKCKMSCGHFTAPDSLFEYVMRELPCGSDSSLPCPVCEDESWDIGELVTKCNMSPDERLFFTRVALINERTKSLKRQWSLPSVFNQDHSFGFSKIGTAKSVPVL